MLIRPGNSRLGEASHTDTSARPDVFSAVLHIGLKFRRNFDILRFPNCVELGDPVARRPEFVMLAPSYSVDPHVSQQAHLTLLKSRPIDRSLAWN